jgi:predicted transcriptional regulator
MELHLSLELQAKVERAAAENKSGAEEYVKQLVEHYVDHDAWFRQQVTRSLELDRGEFLTHEEVGARIDQMFRKREILRSALTTSSRTKGNLAEAIHRRFASFGGIEISLPQRDALR